MSRRVLALSPEGRLFFYATSLTHIAFKMLLGLVMVFDDRYGLRSWPAPPQSLVFAAYDVVTCFGVSKVVDWVVPAGARRGVQAFLLVLLFPFLVTNFIVHTYFKAFVTRGLLEFNGAGASTIADYTRAGLTRYSAGFIAIAALVLLGWSFGYRRLLEGRLVRQTTVPSIAFALALSGLPYLGKMSAGQSGWLRVNPGFDLVRSFVSQHGETIKTASARERRALHAGRSASVRQLHHRARSHRAQVSRRERAVRVDRIAAVRADPARRRDRWPDRARRARARRRRLQQLPHGLSRHQSQLPDLSLRHLSEHGRRDRDQVQAGLSLRVAASIC